MKIKTRTIIFAIFALLLLTILPIILTIYVPQEFFRGISMMIGTDLSSLLSEIEVYGVFVTIFIILNGMYEKTTRIGLGVSIAYKLFSLLGLIYGLSLGKIENLGVAVLGSSGGGASNVVMLDLRIFVVLATVITALMIIHTVIEYRETTLTMQSSQKANKASP